MLASITPLGERARNRRWGVTVAAYVIGSSLAGAAAGGALGLVGQLLIGGPEEHRVLVVSAAVVACTVGAALDARVGGIGPPTIHRQVDEDWLNRYRGWVCGVGFGVQLGAGLSTVVTTASVYVTLVLAFLSAGWLPGCLVGVVFGLVRALPLVGMRRASSPEALRHVHRRMQAWGPVAHRATWGVQLAAAGVMLGVVAS
jgi:hypothetical protein